MQTKSHHTAGDPFETRRGYERDATAPTFRDVTEQLRAWDGVTAPSVLTRDAIAGHLTQAFPSADVSLVSGANTADVRVDDVGIVLAQNYNCADNLDATFGILAEQYDELVFYSTQLHANSPDTWRLLERRYTAGRLGIERVAFLTGKAPADETTESTTKRPPMDALLLLGGGCSVSTAMGGLLLAESYLNTLGQAFYGSVAVYFLVVVLLALFVTKA